MEQDTIIAVELHGVNVDMRKRAGNPAKGSIEFSQGDEEIYCTLCGKPLQEVPLRNMARHCRNIYIQETL